MKTVVGLFDTYAEAQDAADALRSAGIAEADISLVAHQSSSSLTPEEDADGDGVDGSRAAADGAGAGATLGAVAGGTAGLLAGLGMIAIPGFGPVVAAGWLVSTLTAAGVGAAAGAAIGGLAGALTATGIPETEAGYYAEGVRRGGALLTVRADDTNAQRIADILDQSGAVNIDERAGYYRSTGYTGYNPELQPFTTEEVQRDRTAYQNFGNRSIGSASSVGTVDTRGVGERVADSITGDRIDDKTGQVVR